MGVLQDIQNQSEGKRKAIFWTVIIILSVALLFFWGRISINRLKNINVEGMKNDLDIQGLQKELKNIPSIPGL